MKTKDKEPQTVKILGSLQLLSWYMTMTYAKKEKRKTWKKSLFPQR